MLGFTPCEVDQMSLWEFEACMAGYAKANGADEKPGAPSDDEFMAAAMGLY